MKKALTGIAIVAIGLLAGCSAWFGPSIDFTTSTAEGPYPLVVQFTPVPDETVALYTWTFGDGETSNDSSPVHIYREAGTYTVSLVVQLADGGVAEETKEAWIAVRAPMAKAETQYIYWISFAGGAISRGPVGGGTRERVTGGGYPTALDVVDGWVYWADANSEAICRVRTDGTDKETLIAGQHYITDIYVVPETDSIFWVRAPDFYGSKCGGVYRASLSDLDPESLVLYGPAADRYAGHVAFDAIEQTLYWTVTHFPRDYDLVGRDAIRMTPSLGSTETVLYNGIGECSALELDTIPGYAAEHVYWMDHSDCIETANGELVLTTLYRIDVDGSGIHAVLQDEEMTPYLAVDRMAGTLYFTTYDGIERCDLDGSNRELLYEDGAMAGISLAR